MCWSLVNMRAGVMIFVGLETSTFHFLPAAADNSLKRMVKTGWDSNQASGSPPIKPKVSRHWFRGRVFGLGDCRTRQRAALVSIAAVFRPVCGRRAWGLVARRAPGLRSGCFGEFASDHRLSITPQLFVRIGAHCWPGLCGRVSFHRAFPLVPLRSFL